MNNETLHIVDLSAVLHGGKMITHAKLYGELQNTAEGFQKPFIPVGCISYVFNILVNYANKDKVVFCCDREPTIKRGMYPEYKSGRNYEEYMENQKKIAEYILKDCGFEVIAKDGYEADDLIYYLCNKYKKIYKQIHVHAGDQDLYVVIDNNVDIYPTTKNRPYVNRENYETTVDKKEILAYNSVTWCKFLYGCHSDKIPALQPVSLRDAIDKTYSNPTIFPLMGDRDTMLNTISTTFPAAVHQLKLVYPLELDEDIELNNNKLVGDIYEAWGYLLGNSQYGEPYSMPQALLDKAHELVKRYTKC